MTRGQIPHTMPAVLFDGRLKLVNDHPVLPPPRNWALIRTLTAGICRTDLEIIKGYMGFTGVLGHEFVGEVQMCDQSEWIGKRVTGEINAACGHCRMCRRGLARHCPERSVLGILNQDGCMAGFCRLPVANLHAIPSGLSTDRAAFIEPLSAACEILAQINLTGTENIAVLGDGRLGILCAWALATVSDNVTLVGHHQEKLNIARWRSLRTTRTTAEVAGADIVIEATGKPRGFVEAMALCRPRGTIVLKSTLASQGELNLAPIVINEITVVGSRCGLFKEGLAMLQDYPDMPIERLITGKYPIDRALEAFDRARAPGALKVLIEMDTPAET
jgi:alcohol dehydrogenase